MVPIEFGRQEHLRSIIRLYHHAESFILGPVHANMSCHRSSVSSLDSRFTVHLDQPPQNAFFAMS